MESGQDLVQCEVTGRWVPPDEVVVIEGRRVCGEGKKILLEPLASGEGMPGEVAYANISTRIRCAIRDQFLFAVIGAAFLFVGVAVTAGGNPGGQHYPPLMLVLLGQLLPALITVLYFGFMHQYGAQTLGKMAGKIHVRLLSGAPITAQAAWIRSAAYAGPNVLTALAGTTGVGPLAVGVAVAAGLYWLANVNILVDSQGHRAIHDRIAGTVVVPKPGS